MPECYTKAHVRCPADAITMKHLPIFVAIDSRPCVVVGGGEVASRKVALLLKYGARVTVVAPALCGADVTNEAA